MSTKDLASGQKTFWGDDDLGRLYQAVVNLRSQVREAEGLRKTRLALVLTRDADQSLCSNEH
jgi:hypothetical protein